MYVQCPQCDAVFRVNTPVLTQADGIVRCGECGQVFNAMDSLLAVLPESHRAEAPPEQIALAHPHADRADAAEAPTAQDTPFIPSILADDLHHARKKGPARPGRTLAWTFGCLLLAGGLAGQYVWYELDRLYQEPQLQPTLQELCSVTGCELPERKDVSRIELVSRNVYSHPNVEGALMISTTMVNNAPFAQAYPMLGINFSDIRGKTVAARRFLPHEYLGAPVPADLKMEPGVPVTVNLEVVDPGDQALSFQFEFL